MESTGSENQKKSRWFRNYVFAAGIAWFVALSFYIASPGFDFHLLILVGNLIMWPGAVLVFTFIAGLARDEFETREPAGNSISRYWNFALEKWFAVLLVVFSVDFVRGMSTIPVMIYSTMQPASSSGSIGVILENISSVPAPVLFFIQVYLTLFILETAGGIRAGWNALRATLRTGWLRMIAPLLIVLAIPGIPKLALYLAGIKIKPFLTFPFNYTVEFLAAVICVFFVFTMHAYVRRLIKAP